MFFSLSLSWCVSVVIDCNLQVQRLVFSEQGLLFLRDPVSVDTTWRLWFAFRFAFFWRRKYSGNKTSLWRAGSRPYCVENKSRKGGIKQRFICSSFIRHKKGRPRSVAERAIFQNFDCLSGPITVHVFLEWYRDSPWMLCSMFVPNMYTENPTFDIFPSLSLFPPLHHQHLMEIRWEREDTLCVSNRDQASRAGRSSGVRINFPPLVRPPKFLLIKRKICLGVAVCVVAGVAAEPPIRVAC